MQILSNGQVQISNRKTGETKVVRPEELMAISPILFNQYTKTIAQIKADKPATVANPANYLDSNKTDIGTTTTEAPQMDPFALEAGPEAFFSNAQGNSKIPSYDELMAKEQLGKTMNSSRIDFNNIDLGSNGFQLKNNNGLQLVNPNSPLSKIKL